MILKSRDIVEAASIKEELKEIVMPVKTSYKVAKNISSLMVELKTISEEELKMLERYIKKDEEGKPIQINDGSYEITNEELFRKEHDALMEIETEVNILMIHIDELESCSIRPGVLEKIMFMIEGDKNEIS